jgi:uncharacterized protein (DUF305 family)
MSPRHRSRLAAAGLAAFTAAGCHSGTGAATPAPAPPIATAAITVQAGAPGAETRPLTGAEANRLPMPAHTAADVSFMQGMIPHHQQALEMTALVTERTENRNVRLVALRIALSQQDEINLMKSWLRQRNEPVPGEGEHGAHVGHGLMPGMLTPEQMATLAAARGAEFDRHFLTFMIKHHEGAVRMVAELFASPGGGQQTAVFQFASDVDVDQQMEISRMRKLLDLPPRGQ